MYLENLQSLIEKANKENPALADEIMKHIETVVDYGKSLIENAVSLSLGEKPTRDDKRKNAITAKDSLNKLSRKFLHKNLVDADTEIGKFAADYMNEAYKAARQL